MKVFYTFLCTVLFTLFLTSNFNAQPTDGLVAYYPFNGNANDESGTGNNGTVNGATLTTDPWGNNNSAYEFDGSDDYVQINGISSVISASVGSISLWAKTDTTSSAGNYFTSLIDSNNLQHHLCEEKALSCLLLCN